MADYYTLAQLARKLGLAEEEVSHLVARAFLPPRVKNGRHYYSARQAYQLQAAIRLARKQGISLEKAMEKVSTQPLYVIEDSVA